MARRTTPIRRPSRRETRFWARAGLMLLPVIAWTVTRLFLPSGAAWYVAGIVSSPILWHAATGHARRITRWWRRVMVPPDDAAAKPENERTAA
jgi:cation transporter-like permease